MRIAIIAVLAISIVLSLAVSVSAKSPIKGDLATCLSMSTTDATRITTPNGSDIQRVRVMYTPSVVSGFSSTVYVYLNGSDPEEVATTAAQCAGYGVKNLVFRTYKGTMRPGDIRVDLTKKSASGNEGVSNQNSSSQGSSYGSSRRGSSYHTSESSSGGGSSSVDATAVYLRYGFTLSRVADDGQLDVLPSLNIPIGGSDSAMTNERSSDYGSSSRSYSSSSSRRHGGYYSGGSSYYESSSSSSSSYRSPEIEKAMMTERIADRSKGNLAAQIIGAITEAGLRGLIPGAIFETYKAPVASEPTPTTTTPVQNSGGQVINAELH